MGLDVSPFILKLPGSYFLLHNDKKEKKLNRRRLLFQCGVCVCLISFLWNPCSHHFGIMCRRRVAMSFLLLTPYTNKSKCTIFYTTLLFEDVHFQNHTRSNTALLNWTRSTAPLAAMPYGGRFHTQGLCQ